jgi:hypothetical protein
VARDPGQCALDHPPTGQDLEGVQVTGAIDNLEGELERGLGPGDQLACLAAVKKAHKLTAQVCAFCEQQLAADPALRPKDLSGPIEAALSVRVHPLHRASAGPVPDPAFQKQVAEDEE